MSRPEALLPDALTHPCDPNLLAFRTTDELPSLEKVLGQPRALRAIEFGSDVAGPGFNIFVSGLPDSGRTTLTRDYIKRKADTEPVPDDWCYVNNFDNPYRPKVLSLPAGCAATLRDDIKSLINRCQQEIRQVFRSDEYIEERNKLAKSVQEAQEAEFQKLQVAAHQLNFSIIRTPTGFGLIPTINGKHLTPEELGNLSKEHRQKLKELEEKLEQKALETISRVREISEGFHKKLKELDNYTVLFAVDHLVAAVKEGYQGMDKVISHLDAVQADIVDKAEVFREDSDAETDSQWRNRYEIQVLIDNSGLQGAPVVMESNPTYQNLVGRIEHHLVMGVSKTDFTMIRPGALHRANGGYLLLPAREVLLTPYAWQGLERALRDGQIRIQELGNQLGLISTTSLEPEPIPLSAKVILFGTPILYELLRLYDVDFAKLFKVRAEFATIMDRTDENTRDCALFIKSVVDENKLAAFENTAVARIIEHSSRMARDQEKLSTQFGKIADLVRESAYWSKKENAEIVTAKAVDRAIQEMDYRSNLYEELIHEYIKKGSILIDVSGEAIGQVNALSVLMIGDFTFGRPNRVTASVYPGSEGVIDIEKQAELGGPIHTKGVLIISGLLGHRYGQNKPLSLTARLTFEQSYSGVEGDSASAAEFCALLSAIAAVPLRQDRAMTGSVNQLGQIQTIGGVNEKIEGFFTTCKNKGITGTQGVIIPRKNIRNLMLKAEVIETIKAGNFHIWPIDNIDEGLSLLTDMEIGTLQEDGTYSPGTFNQAVDTHLMKFREVLKPEEERSET